MMVARYSDEYTSGLPSDYNGRYVKYDDYEELEAERDHLRLEVQCMQATIDALTRKCTELQDELARATCDKEHCMNCGDRLDVKDGHCENCTARALRWDELTRDKEATP